MEVWWLGGIISPTRMLVVLAATFVPVTILVKGGGFRRQEETRAIDAALDAVEAVALGAIVVAVVLVVLGEIRPDTPLAEIMGKIVYEAAPFAVGAAVARHVFARSRDETDGKQPPKRSPVVATFADVGATMIGALFVAFNIAPTDEIPMLVASASTASLLGVMALSLVSSYAIVFVAGFGDQEHRRTQEGVLQHPLSETVVSYLVALASAAAMLWLFDNLSAPASWSATAGEVVLLGFPAAIGGAAGRLAV